MEFLSEWESSRGKEAVVEKRASWPEGPEARDWVSAGSHLGQVDFSGLPRL